MKVIKEYLDFNKKSFTHDLKEALLYAVHSLQEVEFEEK